MTFAQSLSERQKGEEMTYALSRQAKRAGGLLKGL